MSETIQTKVWKFADDIDTDQIIATQYLVNPDIHDMARYAMEIPKPEFASSVQNDDIIVARNNFGCGSSREQAPQVLKTLGIKMILAVSFARIFYRNCINLGIRPYEIALSQYNLFEDQAIVTFDSQNNCIEVNNESISLNPFPPFVESILAAGGLIAHVTQQFNTNQEKK
jgi:3-isopropylmalate/(R)-2-methylmalate dehydratase small subunit